MLKELRKSVFGIRTGDFMLVGGEYLIIEKATVENDVLYLRTKEYSFELENEDLALYEFFRLEDYSEEVHNQLSFSCKHCNRPVAYDSIEGIKNHLNECIFKTENKSCMLCKHLRIIENPPYPRYFQNRMNPNVTWGVGNYRQPYCMLKELELDEEEFASKHDDCFDYSTEMPDIERSEEYEKWVALSEQIDEEMH